MNNTPQTDRPVYLTRQEVAELLRCTVRHVDGLAARHGEKTLGIRRAGRRTLFHRPTLEQALEAGKLAA